MKGTPQRGFALLAVLWIMTGVAALGLAISIAGRGSIATARNRMELTKAAWRAEDCFERARAAIAEILRTHRADPRAGGEAWIRLDELVARSPFMPGCEDSVRLLPAGLALDLNAARAPELRRLLTRQGYETIQSDSLIDALLDWRDPDDVPRANGVERDWYERAGRSLPRNGPFAHVDELARVRGFDEWERSRTATGRESLGTLFTVEPGRIVLDRAPVAVLTVLPGFTEETLERIAERRMRGAEPLVELLALGAELSLASRDSLHRHFADLVARVTVEPDAWILSARSSSRVAADGARALVATIEARIVRAGPRAAIVRRRTAP
jgi:hypothetical protein